MKTIIYFKTKMAAVEVKEDSVKVTGYGSTGDVDRGNDKVLPTAFTDTIAESQRTSGVAMLLQHDGAKVIGKWDKLEVDNKGLACEGTVKYNTDDCLEKIKNGDLRGLSIGYIIEKYQIEDGQGHVMYYNETGLQPGYDYDALYSEDAIRVITKLELVEISVVATPMNPYSFISSVKKQMEMEMKAIKALAGKSTDDDGGEQEPEPAPEAVVEEPVVTEDEPEEPKVIPEEPAAPEEPAPAEGAEPNTQGSGGEDAGGNPAPVETPEAPAPVESTPVEAGQEAEKAIDAALEKVKPLVAEMVADAVKNATTDLTNENTALKNAVIELKGQVESAINALKSIEAGPNAEHTFIPTGGGMGHKALVTDGMVMKTLGR